MHSFHYNEESRPMRKLSPLLALLLALAAPLAFSQEAAAPAQKTAYVAPPWIYKTKQLNKAQIDKLLSKPNKVVVLDVRRPDELISNWKAIWATSPRTGSSSPFPTAPTGPALPVIC